MNFRREVAFTTDEVNEIAEYAGLTPGQVRGIAYLVELKIRSVGENTEEKTAL